LTHEKQTVTDLLEQRIRDVFINVLGVTDADLTADASPETIPSWDSLTHISLMLAVEGECGTQFEPEDLMELRSFGAVVERVRASLHA
jgi:acyl carrier protein